MSRLSDEIRRAAMGPPAADTAGVTGVYRFGAGFPGFDGHFPGHPVLPAVVQVMTAVALIEDWRGRYLTLAGVENAKFTMQVHPDQAMTVRCRETPAGSRRYEAILETAAGVASSFRLLFPEEGG